jgi:hypothetical protein
LISLASSLGGKCAEQDEAPSLAGVRIMDLREN